jgi:hypothetical protein
VGEGWAGFIESTSGEKSPEGSGEPAGEVREDRVDAFERIADGIVAETVRPAMFRFTSVTQT